MKKVYFCDSLSDAYDADTPRRDTHGHTQKLHTLKHTSPLSLSVAVYTLLSIIFILCFHHFFPPCSPRRPNPLLPLSFLFHCSCFTSSALSSLLAGGQVGLGSRWGIAISFYKQLNSSTHATENDLHHASTLQKIAILKVI